jgi:hypothetical protein
VPLQPTESPFALHLKVRSGRPVPAVCFVLVRDKRGRSREALAAHVNDSCEERASAAGQNFGERNRSAEDVRILSEQVPELGHGIRKRVDATAEKEGGSALHSKRLEGFCQGEVQIVGEVKIQQKSSTVQEKENIIGHISPAASETPHKVRAPVTFEQMENDWARQDTSLRVGLPLPGIRPTSSAPKASPVPAAGSAHVGSSLERSVPDIFELSPAASLTLTPTVSTPVTTEANKRRFVALLFFNTIMKTLKGTSTVSRDFDLFVVLF